ncbi:hypothetical protein ACSNOU_14755 [Acinetobacter oleivorans]|uniref:hypothetical protein n=1 Tax=Acinetobacter oleivorans TaxID=1148157 RepID=UPI003F1E2A29
MADSNLSDTPISSWQRLMWFGVGLGLLLTIIALLAGVGILLMQIVDIIETKGNKDLVFTFSSIGLVTTILIRLLAVLIGAAISFTGLAISFFAYEKAINFSGTLSASETTVAKATLATYSPGIVGMIVGAVIIICAIFAKSNFKYDSPSVITVTQASPATNDNRPKMPLP